MHTIPTQLSNPKSSPWRTVLWVALVWIILIAKSLILCWAIDHYNAPIGHIWIWGPSIIAAILISFLIWKK